ncbi:MAG: thioredoxin-related protein [Bacteroidia bacterium]|jgi:thioredoxin-related protein
MNTLRYVSLIIIFLISTAFVGKVAKSNSELSWLNIEEAQELVKTDPKMVFIDFTAKWCGWCKVMDKKTFSDPEVTEYLNEHFYSVKMDFDSPKKFNYLGAEYTAKELAKKNGITGLPTMLVASSDFKNVNKIVGYQKPKQFINQLKKFKEN